MSNVITVRNGNIMVNGKSWGWIRHFPKDVGHTAGAWIVTWGRSGVARFSDARNTADQAIEKAAERAKKRRQFPA